MIVPWPAAGADGDTVHVPATARILAATPFNFRVAGRVLVWMLPLVGVFAYLYWPTLAGLAAQWATDENYSHGFLIPIVSGYIIWDRREALRRARIVPSLWGYPLLVVAVGLLVISEAAAFGYPGRLSLPLALAGIVLFLGGSQVLRLLLFPIAFLIFMLPLPVPVFNQIAFPLQLVAARIATLTLDVLNIPVLREGNVINLAYARLEVTEACSGIRSLVSLLSLATIFAYFSQRDVLRRSALVLSAIPIALVTNATRVALTGILAHTVGVAAGMGFYHTFSGWLIFVLGVSFLALVSIALSRPRRAAAAP